MLNLNNNQKILSLDVQNWKQFGCNHPSHQIPNMIYLSPGMYEHTCSGCNETKSFVVQGIKL